MSSQAHGRRGREEGGAGDEHACRGEEEGEGEPRHVGPVLAPHAAHEVCLGRRADATQQAAQEVENVPANASLELVENIQGDRSER